MTNNSLWKVVPAVLTLVLVACQDSITGIPDPVVAAAPVVAVEAVSPAAMMTSGPCVRPGTSLISWWPGDDDFEDIPGDPDNWQDVVGSNQIATHASVSIVPGVHDQAFRFSSNTQIEINNSASLQPAAFTVDLWAERLGAGANSDDTYGNMLVQKAIDADGSGLSYSYYISWRADGRISAGVFFQEDLAVGSGFYAPPNRLVSDNTFANGLPIFIALTVDGPDVTLYVNGDVEDALNAETDLGFAAGTSVAYGSGQMVIGANWLPGRMVAFPRTFDGIIDEVEIFSTALTETELEAIQAGGTCKTSNEAPVVDAVTGAPIDEGSTFATSVTFTDDVSQTWTAKVDYGDGTVDPAAPVTGMSVGLSHLYPQNGTYTVTVTVTDNEGAVGFNNSGSVTVNNVAPTVDAGPDATILEGDTFESAGSFTDPGADTWTATVDYGDGSGVQPLALSGKTFELSHTYVGHGSGPFTVTVTVDDGSSVSLAAMVLSVDEVDVTVVFPLTIDQATVKMESARGRWFRRRGKDSYQVDGRIPVEFLELFDPETEDLTVTFAGIEQVILAGSLVRRGGRSNKLRYKAPKHSTGIQRIDLHRDGRFKIQAKGPFNPDLRDANLGEPVDFSLVLGTNIGEASIQLDRRLHFRAHRGRDRNHDADDDDDDDDKHDDDRLKKALKRFLGRRGR